MIPKFKVYNHNTNRILLPSEVEIHFLSETSYVVMRKGRELCNENSSDLLQYTGINDKSNKEIYDADICNDGAAVSFKLGRYVLMYKDGKFEDLIGSEDELISNAYINPELLT